MLVGGVAADYADTQGAIADTLPIVFGWVVLIVLLLLFAFTGSLILPIKAILLNFLSLAATIAATPPPAFSDTPGVMQMGNRGAVSLAGGDFFAAGSVGYSANQGGARADGLELVTDRWTVRPLQVETVTSSFFDDRSVFPAGSIQFDHALIMRDIPHRWMALPDIALGATDCCA